MFFYGPNAAGSLSFSITLISIPMKVIGMSIAQVFIGEASEMLRLSRNGIASLYNKILKRLSLFIVIPTLAIIGLGKSLFPMVFGESWTEAGEFIRILSVCFAFQFISS